MPRNGSSVYTLPPEYQAVDGATATIEQHNVPLEDLEADANDERPISAGGTGAANAADARANLGITDRFDGTTEITPDLADGTKSQGTAIPGQILGADGGQTLAGGFDVTSHDEGTVTTGTYTPDPADSNLQYVTNGGAHTLAPPASDCTVSILYTNNASAGAVTVSGFTSTKGTMTTTNGDQFFVDITVINSVSRMVVTAV